MKRICMALDLVDDADLIAEYENYHQPKNSWSEITDSIQQAGITDMNIYRTGNRLFMIIEADDNFSLGKKAKLDSANPKVQEWEKLMWKFQQPLPWAKNGEKWVEMKSIYELGKSQATDQP
jgi:L-rhamnose mutarotase